RLPRQILVGAPAPRGACFPLRAVAQRLPLGPRLPWVRFDRVLAEGREKRHELLALRRRKARAHADVLEVSRIIIETEEQRADRRLVAVLVPAKAGDDAVAIALVLHLEHDALVRLTGSRLPLRGGTLERR